MLLVDKPGATQTYFWLGNVGASRTDPARTAQSVVNTVFGGRFTSMLNTELRIKSGLTYGASAGFDRGSQPGAFSISSFTETSKTVEAIDMALATLARLHQDGLSAEQLQSARSYILGQFPPTLETNGQIAARLADMLFHGLGPDDVNEYATRVAQVDAEAARKRDRAIVPAARRPRHRADRRRGEDPRRGEEVRPGDGDEAHRPALRAGNEVMQRTALLAGATGLVGGECLRLLLSSPAYSRVIVVTRRPAGLAGAAAARRARSSSILRRSTSVQADLRADHVFCALGTTIKQGRFAGEVPRGGFRLPAALGDAGACARRNALLAGERAGREREVGRVLFARQG